MINAKRERSTPGGMPAAKLDAVEEGLQHKGGGDLVDFIALPRWLLAALMQAFMGAGCCPALILCKDRNGCGLSQQGGKSLGGFSLIAQAAIHVQGQADDQSDGRLLLHR